jgi:hypothetical protein
VGGQLPVRVEALALFDETEGRVLEIPEGLDHVRRQPPLDEDEALGRLESPADLVRRLSQQGRQTRGERLAIFDA